MLHFERVPKPFPGEHFKDKFPLKRDPRGAPDCIEFEWSKEIRTKKDCDTLHMIYLLQLACELHRLRVIERNQYFSSISRPDRYISHIDTPQVKYSDKSRKILLIIPMQQDYARLLTVIRTFTLLFNLYDKFLYIHSAVGSL